VNALPRPGLLSTSTAAPRSLTMECTSESPSPLPAPTSFVVKNGSKIRSSTSGTIPIPESRGDSIRRARVGHKNANFGASTSCDKRFAAVYYYPMLAVAPCGRLHHRGIKPRSPFSSARLRHEKRGSDSACDQRLEEVVSLRGCRNFPNRYISPSSGAIVLQASGPNGDNPVFFRAIAVSRWLK
jgi:hypothetical protein